MLLVNSPPLSIGILDSLRLLSLLSLGKEDCFLDLPLLFLSLFLEIVVLLDFLLLLFGVIQFNYFLHSN